MTPSTPEPQSPGESLSPEDYREKVVELRRQIRIMQESLERKNKELDALHYVWCDGGCRSGSGRWTGEELTEEIVVIAERNVQRLRRHFNNRQAKLGRERTA